MATNININNSGENKDSNNNINVHVNPDPKELKSKSAIPSWAIKIIVGIAVTVIGYFIKVYLDDARAKSNPNVEITR